MSNVLTHEQLREKIAKQMGWWRGSDVGFQYQGLLSWLMELIEGQAQSKADGDLSKFLNILINANAFDEKFEVKDLMKLLGERHRNG